MATDETTAETPDKRIKSHHLVIGLGTGVALFTVIGTLAAVQSQAPGPVAA